MGPGNGAGNAGRDSWAGLGQVPGHAKALCASAPAPGQATEHSRKGSGLSRKAARDLLFIMGVTGVGKLIEFPKKHLRTME